MPLNKMGNFTFKHVDQQDDLYKTKTAAEIKTALDSQPNELKAVLNALIDSLQATVVGDSGAKNLGVSAISGVTGANVQAVLEDLKLQINGAVAGSIPPGTITQDKLAFSIATNAASTTIADTGNHFTATNVEGALDELFTSANSVKTNVSGAIGSPATVNDTGAQLASKITTEKGRIASEVGDGSSADTLKYLIDRLIVRSDAIATAVNAKGVASTSADTLAQLATKIGLISAGGKSFEGTVTSPSGNANFTYANGTIIASPHVTVTGLDFTPSSVEIWGAPVNGITVCLPENMEGNNGRIVKTGSVSSVTANAISVANFQLDGTNAYLVAGGFRLPVNTGSYMYKYRAIE